MSTQKHTLTPWVLWDEPSRAPDGSYPIFGPMPDNTGYVFYPRICSVKALCGPIANSNPDEANAAFIVLACNTHDKLLEAARAAERELDGHRCNYRGGVICNKCVITRQLRAAIAAGTEQGA